LPTTPGKPLARSARADSYIPGRHHHQFPEGAEGRG
jgi:hypothetical protein